MLRSRRITALIITAIMLISMLPTFAVAETPDVGIDLDEVAYVTLTESSGYSDYVTFTPEKTGKYLFTVGTDAMVNLSAVCVEEDIENGFAVWSSYGSSFEESATLYGGLTYYINVSVDMKFSPPKGDVDVTVLAEEIAVESIEIINEPYDTEIYDTELDTAEFWGLMLYVEYSDGSSENVSYDDYYFGNVEMEFDIDTDTGEVTVSFFGATDVFEITVIENPVKKIEYVSKENVKITENTYCYESTTDEDEPFNYYYGYESSVDDLGDVFKITFSDGKVGYYSLWDEELDNFDFWISVYDDQYTNPWKIGVNYFTVSCCTHEIKVPVEIVASSVKSVKINKAPSYVYTYGDMLEGIMTTEGYLLWPVKVDDLEFTVTYKDGKVKTYKGTDLDFYMSEIDGMYYDIQTYIDNATVGKNTVTFNFGGFETQYDITVKESDVKKVELVKEPDVKTYSDYFTPSFVGAEVKITKKDNTSVTYKVTKDNIYIEGDGVCVFDEKTGNPVFSFVFEYDYEEETRTFTLDCYGVECPVDCMEYVGEEYDYIEFKNENPDFKDMEVVAYKGDSFETFKITNDITSFYGFGGFGGDPDISYFFANSYCEKGIFHAEMELELYHGVPAYYNVYALGNSWSKEVLAEEPQVKSISIRTESYKVRYVKGEKFDPDGISVNIDYGNGVSGVAYYGIHDIEVDKVDTSTLGKKTVTVNFYGKKATFEIKVADGFADVKKGNWYEKYVNYAASYGIFDGTDEAQNLFSPNTEVTRAQAVKILANLAGVDTSNNNVDAGFTDTPKGKWYTGAVKWAKETGITEGVGDGSFRPDEKITREQLCVMLTSYVEDYMDATLIKVESGADFKDAKSISKWATASVDACQRAGLISGMGDGTFAPRQTATRAQAATIFAEFHLEFPVR